MDIRESTVTSEEFQHVFLEKHVRSRPREAGWSGIVLREIDNYPCMGQWNHVTILHAMHADLGENA